jgi:hypothetical protein
MNREILEKPFMPEQIKQRQGTDGDVFDHVEGCAVNHTNGSYPA